MSDRPEEKLRSEILQHIHDWIKGGMGEEDENTSRIDEMIAKAILKAREEALEAAAAYIEGKGGVIPGAAVFAPLVSRNNMPDMSGDPRARLRPQDRWRFDEATASLASAIRQHSQKGER